MNTQDCLQLLGTLGVAGLIGGGIAGMLGGERKRQEQERERQQQDAQLDRVGLLKAERRHRKESKFQAQNPEVAKQYYDVVVVVKNPADANGDGWAVHCKTGSLHKFRENVAGFSVGVLGNFNCGKTFILTQLTEEPGDFPCGSTVHTQGLSMKLVSLRKTAEGLGTRVWLIDTQGLNTSALQEDDAEMSSGEAPNDREEEEKLKMMQASEDYLRQVVVSSANVFIYVVNYLTRQDEIDLQRLYSTLKTRKSSDLRVIVVHNRKEVTHSQLEEDKYIDKVERRFRGRFQRQNEVEGFSFLFGEIQAHQHVRVSVQHFFLTKNDSSDCKNKLVFDYLKQILGGYPVEKTNMQQRLLNTMTEHLPAFLHIQEKDPRSKPKLVLTEECGNERACIKWNTAQQKVEVKCRGLGSWVSQVHDDVHCNFNKTVCWPKSHHKTPQPRIMVILGIELAGLDPATFLALKQCIRKPADRDPELLRSAHLYCTKLDGEEGVVQVELEATLPSIPASMSAALTNDEAEALLEQTENMDQNSTQKLQPTFSRGSCGIVQTKDSLRCKVTDQGTRRVMEGRLEKTLRFARIFEQKELPWDSTYDPVVAYESGVLAIGFVTNQEPTEADLAELEVVPEEMAPDEAVPSSTCPAEITVPLAGDRSAATESVTSSQSTWIQLPAEAETKLPAAAP